MATGGTVRNSPPLTVVTTSAPSSRQRMGGNKFHSSSSQQQPPPPPQLITAIATNHNNRNNSNNNNSSNNNNGGTTRQPIPASVVSIQQPPPPIIKEDESIDLPVDAALLSALRDQRERVALLRLEQRLVEFTNDPNLTQIDVGPGANSNGNGNGNAGGGVGSNNNTNNNNDSPSSPTDETLPPLHLSLQNFNLRTSFHRKCLHKLADRFRISRETVDNNVIRLVKGRDSRVPSRLLFDLVSRGGEGRTAEDGKGRYGKRVVMGSSSGGAGVGISGGTTTNGSGPVSPTGVVPLPQDKGESSGGTSGMGGGEGTSDRPSSAPVISTTTTTVREKKKTKKKDKIKIFQRSGKDKGSNGSLHKASTPTNPNNGSDPNRWKKNLSDKEKAYAEARARIFNSSLNENNTSKGNGVAQTEDAVCSVDASGGLAAPVVPMRKLDPSTVGAAEFYIGRPIVDSGQVVDGSLGVTTVSPAESPAAGSSLSPRNSVVGGGAGGEGGGGDATGEVMEGNGTGVSIGSGGGGGGGSDGNVNHDNNNNGSIHSNQSNINSNSSSNSNNSNEDNNNRHIHSNNNKNNTVPAAVTTGATSKVTWRNRQQEASDPDFQRGVHVVGGLGVPMNAPPVSYHYHSSHLHHHQQLSANQCGNMAHNVMNGYHYNTGASSATGGGMLDMNGYHQGDSSTSWQRQDGGAGCRASANSVHQAQQIPPVIYSNTSPSVHHGQYQVMSQHQQHQYSGSVGMQLGSSGGSGGGGSSGDGGGNVPTATTSHHRQGSAPLLRDAPVETANSRLVYTAEDFPALG